MQSLPPPPAPPPEQIARQEAAFGFVVLTDVPLTITRAKRDERAFARYQIYMKTDVRLVALPPAIDSTILRFECRWKLTAHLQRQFCFESITAQFGCSETTLSDLPDFEAASRSSAEGQACGLIMPGLEEARLRFEAKLRETRASRYEPDLQRAVLPMLARSGATVKVGPPQDQR